MAQSRAPEKGSNNSFQNNKMKKNKKGNSGQEFSQVEDKKK